MNIKWQEIEEKHPKSWCMVLAMYDNKRIAGSEIFTYFMYQNTWEIEHDCENTITYTDIPDSFIYALLEDFFDANGIMISIFYDRVNGKWLFDVEIIQSMIPVSDNEFDEKNEAKEQAILKAFDILESRLKDGWKWK